MSYVVQASPLTRIFLREFQAKLIANPKLILEMKEPFEVLIPRSTGGIRLTHMKPVHQFNLLPRKHYVQQADGTQRELKGQRQAAGDEIRDLVPWLTGGPDGMGSEETDIYGVVMLDIDSDVVTQMVEMMQRRSFDLAAASGVETDLGAELVRMQKEYQHQIAQAVAKAKEIANAKVRRALMITHQNLIQTWDTLETEGKKPYQASPAEGLGAFILQEEIAQSNASRKAMHGLLSRNTPVVNG